MRDFILLVISLVFAVFTLVITLLMVFFYRQEWHFKTGSLLYSAVLSFMMLPILILFSGARLNMIVGGLLFIVGIFIGGMRGITVTLYYQGNHVVGKNSVFSMLLWGGSLVISMLMNNLNSALMASLGIMPLYLTTGMQVALNGTLLLRRALMRPAAASL